MRIANIICERELKIDDKFNIVDSFDKLIPNLPTLIIGIDNAKSHTKNLSYLNRTIDDNTFWTFTRMEKRDLFEEDLFYFIEYSYHKLINDIEFNFIDLILSDSDKINSVFQEISNHNKVITFLHQNMVYLHLGDKIYGFDLRQVEYIGKSISKFLIKVESMSSVFLRDDKILIEYKKELNMFKDEIKYVPLIYSIRNNE